MVSTKRKSDAPVAVAAKRVRSHPTSEEALNELSKDELVQHVLELQEQLQTTIATVPKATEYTANELKEKASKARQMLIKGISKQMKASANPNLIYSNSHPDDVQWTPSCKTGKARFVHEGHIEDERIFKAMFGLPDAHNKKMFKMTRMDFADVVGCPQGKVRYSLLEITGADVNIRWIAEEKTLKVSGTYGV
jgi:hypothetical protein